MNIQDARMRKGYWGSKILNKSGPCTARCSAWGTSCGKIIEIII